MSPAQTTKTYDAVIIGAGPGGLATIISLIDGGLRNILWVDRSFGGGRLNELYREISSNTKVGIYLDAIGSSSTCKKIIASTPSPNAIDELRSIDNEETCQLSLAGDMIKLLEAGVVGIEGVENCVGEVKEATYENARWNVVLPSSSNATTCRLFLCTGSHPIVPDPPIHKQYAPELRVLDLDQCMLKSRLPTLFADTLGQSHVKPKKVVVAVIGNSHSGILVCRNLYEVSQETKLDIKILNFRRRGIKYAEYRDDGIVYDNTGLKGATADWAKEVMDGPNPPPTIEQIDLGEDEDKVYRERLNECTHIIYAIGYEANPYPALYLNKNKEAKEGGLDNTANANGNTNENDHLDRDQDRLRVDKKLEFDQHTSGFKVDGEAVEGLFGLGIAHPEETEDPEGNVEAAVGLAKFFKFAQRVQDHWVKVGDKGRCR
ncbi:hypothetical protein I317_04940 [Kwoniella heveanensis CBS 569]|nr:hypothetical protein I317_04940 [Kwoniella heveanensis CBS 569]